MGSVEHSEQLQHLILVALHRHGLSFRLLVGAAVVVQLLLVHFGLGHQNLVVLQLRYGFGQAFIIFDKLRYLE